MTFTLGLPQPLERLVRRQAGRLRITRNAFIQRAIEEQLQRDEQRAPQSQAA